MQEDSKPTRETDPPASAGCASDCASETSIEALNRSCYCLSLDEPALRKGLDADLGSRGLSQAMVLSHPHLFSAVPMFVSSEHLDQLGSRDCQVEVESQQATRRTGIVPGDLGRP